MILMIVEACAPQPRSRFIQVLANVPQTAPGTAWSGEKTVFESQVLGHLRPGDRLLLVGVDASSYTDDPVFDATLETASVLGANALDAKRQNRKVRQDAEAAFEQLHGSTAGHRTEIVSAILAASQRFEGRPAAQNVLILESTGYEQSGVINMGDARLKLTQSTIEATIDKIRRAGELPRLDGVRVCFAGITSGQGGWAASRRVVTIEAFWRAFFRAGGARLISYGAALTNCL